MCIDIWRNKARVVPKIAIIKERTPTTAPKVALSRERERERECVLESQREIIRSFKRGGGRS